jgi:hypothetical protein
MTVADSVQAHYASGLALLRERNRLPEAEAAFRAGLAADPGHAGCMLQLGITLRVLGRWKEAARVLEDTRRLSPEDPAVHLQIGTVLRWQRNWEAAVRSFDEAIALDPSHADARCNRAITLMELNRLPEALTSLDLLITELPAGTIARFGLLERREEAVGRLARMGLCGLDFALSPQQRAIALYQQANKLIINGNVDAALLFYQDAALLAPDYSDPAFPIGATVAVQMARRPIGQHLSCHWLEEGLHFHEHRLRFCCTSHSGGKGWADIGAYQGGPVPVDFVLARRAQLVRGNQTGEDNPCRGCHELERRAWPAKPWPFSALIINSYSICNMKCSYCSLAIAHFEMPSYYYLVEPALDHLVAQGWLAPDAHVTWGGGDPSVSKEFEAIASKLLSTGRYFCINTNATRALPVLLDGLRQGRCDVTVSIDSGTPETFYRIKYMSDRPVRFQGRPAYDAVWTSIGQYAAAASEQLVVKYIFTAENANEADITSFISQCLAQGVTRIMLTPEAALLAAGKVPPEVWQAIHRTRALAEASRLLVLFNPIDPGSDSLPADLRPAPALEVKA